jgi:hypothetical protein
MAEWVQPLVMENTTFYFAWIAVAEARRPPGAIFILHVF